MWQLLVRGVGEAVLISISTASSSDSPAVGPVLRAVSQLPKAR